MISNVPLPAGIMSRLPSRFNTCRGILLTRLSNKHIPAKSMTTRTISLSPLNRIDESKKDESVSGSGPSAISRSGFAISFDKFGGNESFVKLLRHCPLTQVSLVEIQNTK